MTILFEKKFTPIHLEYLIKNYWKKANSITNEQVIFDLRRIEWIAVEEITFLFAWFRYLLIKKKKIKILLPDYNSNFKSYNALNNLWGKWKIYSFYYTLLDGTGQLEDYFNVDYRVNNIINDQIRKQIFNQENLEDDITVVPFQAINTSGYGEIENIDDFIINKVHKSLNLAEQVFKVIENYTELPAKENILLSKIIANELFLNVIHHSIIRENPEITECYFAISLKREFTRKNIYKSELYKNQFENKSHINSINKEISNQEIEKKFEFYLSTVLPNGYESERSLETLDFFKNDKGSKHKYRNESFIEFTFLDFGVGIPYTLKEEYEKSIKSELQHDIINQFNENFITKNVDTQILEYAFFLNSSRHPIDLDLQNKYEIPRGLYFLIDIIRRYQGLVVVRSRRGKIIYDFSKEVNEIKEAVKYSNEDSSLSDFEGTLISVVIPASQNFTDKVSNIKPQYKGNYSTANKITIYYALIDVLNKIEIDFFEKNNAYPSLQEVYRELFNMLDKILIDNNKNSCLVLFDFTGFNIFPLKHKLLHFFSSSPNVNEVTSVVLLNFNNLEIINDVKNSIAYKLSRSLNSNFLYKPVPIINYDGAIYWLGVLNSQDELKLNELLMYDSYYISQSDLTAPQIYQGNFLIFDKYGNIKSTILTQSEILNYIRNER